MGFAPRISLDSPHGRAVASSADLRDLAISAVVIRLNKKKALADRLRKEGDGRFERFARLSLPGVAGQTLDDQRTLGPLRREKIECGVDRRRGALGGLTRGVFPPQEQIERRLDSLAAQGGAEEIFIYRVPRLGGFKFVVDDAITVLFRLVVDAVHAPAYGEPVQRARPVLWQPIRSLTLEGDGPISGLEKLFEVLGNHLLEKRRDPFAEDLPGERITDRIILLEVEKSSLRYGFKDRRGLP